MIPAGRTPVAIAEAAAMHGVSLATAKRRHLLDDLRPLTPGRSNMLWDKEQVAAHAAGQPIPDLPGESPDDLLARGECAARWGIGTQTWTTAVHRGYAPAPDTTLYGHDLWRCEAVDTFPRPGRGSNAGRPRGSKDQAPRKTGMRSAVHQRRVADTARMDASARDAGHDLTGAEVAAVLGVTERTGQRLLAKARHQ